ncbi:DMT family transporter [Marinobacter zhanjiangensis]|uniref:Membrane protein n=1 Tax=Marinobacter zhanjiangensis TaxID=578215 RepID=A0ABQ3B2F8_9GAMM|nr:DMT family transporter [Marinobacter zhanjiangensis]GGY75392.1 membrane protein [Marinobacter zhanjiangensis]
MKDQRRAMLFGLGAVLLWSTVATAFKLTLGYYTPLQMLLMACLTSVAVLALLLAIRGQLSGVFRLSRRQYLQSLALGLINPFLYYLLLFGAFDRLPAQEAQPINYTWALVLAYLSVPFLGHSLRVTDILAGLVCYGGVVVIATRGDLSDLSFSDPVGVALAIGSTLVWATYWILATRDNREPVTGLLLNFLFGLPFIFAVTWWQDGLPPLASGGFAGSLYVGVFEMGLAFVLWSRAMKLATNTARVSNLIFISPFLSLVFIYLILGEVILASTWVGLILIVAGLWLQQSGSNRAGAGEQAHD